MGDDEFLSRQFEANRSHLRAVALRMLGSTAEADDAVQETWVRLARTDTTDVGNLGGWLTTVVGRVCLDMLRSRTAKRTEPIGDKAADNRPVAISPEDEAMLADAVGPALLVVLETLNPSERLAFVLHDLFGVPFDEIATIVGRSPAAARQLASRGRRRVQGTATVPDADLVRQREVVDAFLAASRAGDFTRLLQLLDPDVIVRADPAAVRMGSEPELVGATTVVQTFAGRAQGARPALVDGVVGLAWLVGGSPKVVFDLVIDGDHIVEIELIADTDRMAAMAIDTLE